MFTNKWCSVLKNKTHNTNVCYYNTKKDYFDRSKISSENRQTKKMDLTQMIDVTY